jgi:hypothetical protein
LFVNKEANRTSAAGRVVGHFTNFGSARRRSERFADGVSRRSSFSLWVSVFGMPPRLNCRTAAAQTLTAHRLRRRCSVFRATCADARRGKPECRQPPRGKRRRVCCAPFAKSRTDIITRPAQRWVIGKPLATRLKIIDITDGLILPPGSKGISGDAEQVIPGPTRNEATASAAAREA